MPPPRPTISTRNLPRDQESAAGSTQAAARGAPALSPLTPMVVVVSRSAATPRLRSPSPPPGADAADPLSAPPAVLARRPSVLPTMPPPVPHSTPADIQSTAANGDAAMPAVRAPAALRGSMPLAADPVQDALVPRVTEMVTGSERQLPTPPAGDATEDAENAPNALPRDTPVADGVVDRVPDTDRRGSSLGTGNLGSATSIPFSDQRDHSDQSDSDSESDDDDALHRPPTCPITTVPVYEALAGPLGSVALSPSARDIAVPTRTGLAILDLYDPYGDPRLVTRAIPPLIGNTQPQLQPAVKVAWNPHLARQQWVASTDRTHVVVWNLTHPGSASSTPLATPPGSPPPTLRRNVGTPSDPIVPLAAYTSPTPTPTTSTTPSIETVLSAHTRAVTSLAWSPAHADMLATASLDGTVRLWDLRRRGAPVNTFSTWGDPIFDVAWNNVNSWRFATASAAGAHVWDVRRGCDPVHALAHGARVESVAWHPTRDAQLVTGAADGRVRSWDTVAPLSAVVSWDAGFPVGKAMYSPRGMAVAAVSSRICDPVRIWSTADSGRKPWTLAIRGATDVVWRECPYHAPRMHHHSAPLEPEVQLVVWAGNGREAHVVPLASVGVPDLDHPARALALVPSATGWAAPPTTSFRGNVGSTWPPSTELAKAREFRARSATYRALVASARKSAEDADAAAAAAAAVAVAEPVVPAVAAAAAATPVVPRPAVGLTNLKQEVAWVTSRYTNVTFESVQLDAPSCVTAILHGPWGPGRALVPVRVTMSFPPNYPHLAAPVIDVVGTGASALAPTTRAMLLAQLKQLAERNVARHRVCIEPCLRLVLGQAIAPRPMSGIGVALTEGSGRSTPDGGLGEEDEDAESSETVSLAGVRIDPGHHHHDGGIPRGLGPSAATTAVPPPASGPATATAAVEDDHYVDHRNYDQCIPFPRLATVAWSARGHLAIILNPWPRTLAKPSVSTTTTTPPVEIPRAYDQFLEYRAQVLDLASSANKPHLLGDDAASLLGHDELVDEEDMLIPTAYFAKPVGAAGTGDDLVKRVRSKFFPSSSATPWSGARDRRTSAVAVATPVVTVTATPPPSAATSLQVPPGFGAAGTSYSGATVRSAWTGTDRATPSTAVVATATGVGARSAVVSLRELFPTRVPHRAVTVLDLSPLVPFDAYLARHALVLPRPGTMDLAHVCRHNAAVSAQCGKHDHAPMWRAAEVVLSGRRNVVPVDGVRAARAGTDGAAAFARSVVARILAHWERRHDVQALALFASVFEAAMDEDVAAAEGGSGVGMVGSGTMTPGRVPTVSVSNSARDLGVVTTTNTTPTAPAGGGWLAAAADAAMAVASRSGLRSVPVSPDPTSMRVTATLATAIPPVPALPPMSQPPSPTALAPTASGLSSARPSFAGSLPGLDAAAAAQLALRAASVSQASNPPSPVLMASPALAPADLQQRVHVEFPTSTKPSRPPPLVAPDQLARARAAQVAYLALVDAAQLHEPRGVLARALARRVVRTAGTRGAAAERAVAQCIGAPRDELEVAVGRKCGGCGDPVPSASPSVARVPKGAVSPKYCQCQQNVVVAAAGKVESGGVLRCMLCRAPVRGLAVLCAHCGHGGHAAHVAAWFASDGGANGCAARGCTCRCPTLRARGGGGGARAQVESAWAAGAGPARRAVVPPAAALGGGVRSRTG